MKLKLKSKKTTTPLQLKSKKVKEPKEKRKIGNPFIPKQGKSRFWTPMYKCTTPKTRGCTMKKVTTASIFALTIATIVVNLIWIIGGIYNSQTGEELISYQVEAISLGIGLFFLLPFWIIFVIVNSVVKEDRIFKIILIVVGVVAVLWLVLYFAI